MLTAGSFGVKVHVHRGILQQAITQVFEEKKAHPEAGIIVNVSYMEIYQEQSSRSHTIFTLYMERRVGRFPTEQDVTIAKLNLVDLAGVERLKKSNTDTGGLMRREACTINKIPLFPRDGSRAEASSGVEVLVGVSLSLFFPAFFSLQGVDVATVFSVWRVLRCMTWFQGSGVQFWSSCWKEEICVRRATEFQHCTLGTLRVGSVPLGQPRGVVAICADVFVFRKWTCFN